MRPAKFIGAGFAAFVIVFACAAMRASHAANLPATSPIEQGRQVFATNCSVGYCHGLEGRAGKGPRLRDRMWSRSYLRSTIENGIPNSSMPAWKNRLPASSIDTVVAYILSIGRQEAEPDGPQISKEPEPARPSLDETAKAGKTLFFDPMRDRNCGVCHEIDGSGTAVAASFGNTALQDDANLVRQMLASPASARTLEITTSEGERICGISAGTVSSGVRIYDVAGSGPPVLRTIKSASVSKAVPCPSVYPHGSNAREYSEAELKTIAGFLRSLPSRHSP